MVALPLVVQALLGMGYDHSALQRRQGVGGSFHLYCFLKNVWTDKFKRYMRITHALLNGKCKPTTVINVLKFKLNDLHHEEIWQV